MSSRREQLENALATCFARGARMAGEAREMLAVYADDLQSEGDPRGELIALDLLIEAHGTTTELVARRASLLAAWLGAYRPVDNPHHAWVGDTFRLGFIEDLELDSRDANTIERLPGLLASPAGRYLRGATVRGDGAFVERALLVLAAHHHAWLERLAIVSPWGSWMSAETVDAIIVATPRLEHLVVGGMSVLRAFPHPNLRSLEVIGTTALAALAGVDGPAMEIVELALNFNVPQEPYGGEPEVDDEPPPEDGPDEPTADDAAPARRSAPSIDLDAFLVPARFPELRRLDLSLNEPTAPAQPSHLYDGMTVFALLGRLAIRTQLASVKLPSLRAKRDVQDLDKTLAGMPRLEELEIVRAQQFRPPDLHHARARIVVDATKWPWPPAHERRGAQGLRVRIPGTRAPDVVALRHAYTAMEWRWAAFPADARAAWTALWAFLEQLGDGGPRPFAMDTLIRAVEACGEALDEGGWRELLEDMRDRRTGPGAAVAIERCVA
ncbi:MAG: hypothetical protein KIT31_14240 [Deltaproteobacteria bacterium]|nr:hypothetical protein [Deltaproteobacteria bacterium]